MKRIINKSLDILFHLYVELIIFFLGIKSKKKKTRSKEKRIMALPYYSKNYPGGQSRIADWQNYFIKDGIQFDVFWASEASSFLEDFYSDKPFKRYRFFFHVLNRRIKLVRILHRYDAIWIQRAFIPFYPFKNEKFEKLVVKRNSNVIMDFYDADYESNYELTVNAAKRAAKVSVASEHLLNFFKKINPAVHYLPFAIKHEDYSLKEYTEKNEIIIGWMGSPTNFKNIQDIESSLNEVESLNPNVRFVFVCRETFNMKLERVTFLSWDDPKFNYHETISSFDIGLAPMITKNERNLAKTAFKSLEYMSSGIAFVSSQWGIPKHLKNKENVLIATNLKRMDKSDYSSREKFGVKKEVREKIIRNASFQILIC